MMGILGSLGRFLTAEHRWSSDPQTGPTADASNPSAAGPGESADLYECPDCETTYISSAMDDCPECRASVEAVPDEHDLGIT